ncbi:MAG: hypothetical protein V2I97_20510 [Desulfococcaceae bacterium]|jgi:hypothetical protein|nr:hypothetical protein [Desulfococcaceae bacterium]
MAEIISLENKLREAGKLNNPLVQKRKLAAVRSLFQRARRSLRCEKCFRRMDEEKVEEKIRNLRVPYRFCDSCAQEYIDYIDRLQGRGNPEQYWHNEAWMRVWQRWIDYQGALDNYMKTDQFRQLIQELNPGPAEE